MALKINSTKVYPQTTDFKTFSLIDANDDEQLSELEYPFASVLKFEENAKKFNESDFDIHFFKNRFRFNEQCIFKLYKENTNNDNAFGWFFPISVFNEGQQIIETDIEKINALEKSSNERFLIEQVLYPAFRCLLLDKNDHSKNVEEISNLSDFYDSEAYILIIHSETFSKKLQLKIEFILPDLFSNGFCYIEKQIDFDKKEDLKKNTKNEVPKFGNLVVKSISPQLIGEVYIHELFKGLLSEKLHPLMRFHILYQVIELLINKIGYQNFEQEKAQVTNKQFNNYKEITDFLDDFKMNESSRIKQLFETKSTVSVSKYPLIMTTSLAQKEDLAPRVYEIRNKLVHGFHFLKTQDPTIEVEIEQLNREFEQLIVETIIQYT
jgi:hypothetical protein